MVYGNYLFDWLIGDPIFSPAEKPPAAYARMILKLQVTFNIVDISNGSILIWRTLWGVSLTDTSLIALHVYVFTWITVPNPIVYSQ